MAGVARETTAYDFLSPEDDDVLRRQKVNDEGEREPDIRQSEPGEHQGESVVLSML